MRPTVCLHADTPQCRYCDEPGPLIVTVNGKTVMHVCAVHAETTDPEVEALIDLFAHVPLTRRRRR